MNCPKCKTQMILGKAIKPNSEANALYVIEPPLINAKTLKLIDVLKCPACGHSDNGANI